MYLKSSFPKHDLRIWYWQYKLISWLGAYHAWEKSSSYTDTVNKCIFTHGRKLSPWGLLNDFIPLSWCDTVTKVMPNEHQNMKHRMIFRGFFGTQRFREDSRSCCRCLRNTTCGRTMAYDDVTNDLMFYNVYTIFCMLTSELRDSVRPTRRSPPNLKMSLFVCPSLLKFGTV